MYEQILITLISALAYMFLFWLPKRIKEDYDKLDPKKVVRTLIWGIVVAIFLIYYDISPTTSNIEHWVGTLMGYGVLIAIVDKATILVYRLIIERLLEKYRALVGN